jgi:hypothetical protein
MGRPSYLLLIVAIGGVMCLASSSFALVVFRDDLQSHNTGDAMHNLVPPVGEGYYWLGANHYGFVNDNTTTPPGGASGEKFIGGLANLAGYGQQNLVITEAAELSATNQVVQFNLDAYVVGSATQSYGLDLSTFASGGVYAGRAWDINLQTNGTLAIYDDSGYNNVPGGTFRTDTWVQVEVIADYAARTFQATVDGFTFGGNFSTDEANSTFRRVSVNEAGNTPAFIDNVTVKINGLGVPGDYNGDGAVDAADYTVWRDNLGASISLPNEVVTPGAVTPEDYDEWVLRFGDSALGGSAASLSSAAVPEPNTLLISCIAGVATVGIRRTFRVFI